MVTVVILSCGTGLTKHTQVTKILRSRVSVSCSIELGVKAFGVAKKRCTMACVIRVSIPAVLYKHFKLILFSS